MSGIASTRAPEIHEVGHRSTFCLPFRSVWASRGKVVRPERISDFYEQGRVHYVGPFARLEDQMCAFTVDFNRNEMGYSPDRVDALVWGLTELMIDVGERRLLIA